MGILIVNYAGLERADDIYIHDNYFDHSTVGSFTNNNDQYSYANQNDSTGCDVTPEFADSQAVYTTRNLRVEHNSFYNEGQGALTLNHARWVGVRNNTFWNDAQVHNSGTDFGGIIFSDECGDTVEISGNTISGAPPAQGPITGLNGLEIYGRNITVSGNTISQLYFEAITARNTYNLQILNNTLYDNDTQGSNGLGAISLFDVLTIGSAPDWSRRAVNTTITGNNIGNVSTAYQGWGIVLAYTSPNAIPLNTTIGYNNLYYGNGNRIGPACFFDQSPFPYLPLTPNPQGVSTPGTSISWSTCP